MIHFFEANTNKLPALLIVALNAPLGFAPKPNPAYNPGAIERRERRTKERAER